MEKRVRGLGLVKTWAVVVGCGLPWLSMALAEEPVNFADAILKEAVEEQLYCADPTPTQMLGLTYLCANASAITDLTGLEYAASLEYLDVCFNQILHLSPLAGLTNLKTLILNNNGFSSVSDLSGLCNLEFLDMHNNEIDDISALSGLIALRTLILRDNRVSDISALSGLTSLETLWLQHNQISDLSALSGVSHLQELLLNENQISDLSALSGMDDLRTLDLADNQISDLSALSGLDLLDTLSLDRNQISDLSGLSSLANLQDLSLSENQISDISPLTGLMSLRSLDLMYNPLGPEAYERDIPQIEENNPGLSISYIPRDPLCLRVSSTAGGDVSSPGEGEFMFLYGSRVRLEAKADPGFLFAHWSGSLYSLNNPTSVTMRQDREIRAHFRSDLDQLVVDDDASGDPGSGDLTLSDPNENGTPGHPFDGIQEAFEVAKEGATILIRPGIYRETLDLSGKAIHLMGIDPGSAVESYPVIDGAGQGPVVLFTGGEDLECRLEGLEITRGRGRVAGAIQSSGGRLTLVNCLIVGNRAVDWDGSAVYCVDGTATLIHCTVADNIGGEYGAGIGLVNSIALLINSIVWMNGPTEILSNGGQPLITYTDVAGGWLGVGNKDEDPLFAEVGAWVDPDDPNRVVGRGDPRAVWRGGDYHLRSTAGRWNPTTRTWDLDLQVSPCIDAGDPLSPLALSPWPNGGVVNMGAYGGTAQASLSQAQ